MFLVFLKFLISFVCFSDEDIELSKGSQVSTIILFGLSVLWFIFAAFKTCDLVLFL